MKKTIYLSIFKGGFFSNEILCHTLKKVYGDPAMNPETWSGTQIHTNKDKWTITKGSIGILGIIFLSPLSSDGGSAPNIKSTWLQPKTQYLVIQLYGKLTQGQKYLLYAEFTGELADDLAGFYRSEYEEDGVRKLDPFSIALYIYNNICIGEWILNSNQSVCCAFSGLLPPLRCIQLMPERPSLVLMSQL